MPGRDFDPELIGRLAERMEETGRALKVVVSIQAQVASLSTSIESAHARLKRMEEAINGTEQAQGLRTDMALMTNNLKGMRDDLNELGDWQKNHERETIESLKDEKKGHESAQIQDKQNWLQNWIAIAAVIIALGSMIGSCGPQWVKAMSPEPAKTTSDG